jgi:hypothetical protein
VFLSRFVIFSFLALQRLQGKSGMAGTRGLLSCPGDLFLGSLKTLFLWFYIGTRSALVESCRVGWPGVG